MLKSLLALALHMQHLILIGHSPAQSYAEACFQQTREMLSSNALQARAPSLPMQVRALVGRRSGSSDLLPDASGEFSVPFPHVERCSAPYDVDHGAFCLNRGRYLRRSFYLRCGAYDVVRGYSILHGDTSLVTSHCPHGFVCRKNLAPPAMVHGTWFPWSPQARPSIVCTRVEEGAKQYDSRKPPRGPRPRRRRGGRRGSTNGKADTGGRVAPFSYMPLAGGEEDGPRPPIVEHDFMGVGPRRQQTSVIEPPSAD